MADKKLSDYPWMKLHFAQFMIDCMGKSTQQIGEMMMATISAWTNDDYNSLPNFAKNAADERFLKTKIYTTNREQNTTSCGETTTIDNNCITIDNNSEQLPIFSSLISSSLISSSLSFKDSFDMFRSKYPGTKRGNETEFDNFVKKYKDWKSILPLLSDIIDKQIAHKKEMEEAKMFVPEWKHLSTWINNRGWEEELPAIKDKNIPDWMMGAQSGYKL